MAEMTADDVLEFVKLLRENDIELFIDGGWGVDALLGEQMRPHADLDIAIQHKDVAKVRALLEARGYTDVPRDDSWECNFVLGDEQGHQIDIHSYTFDAEGKNIYGVAYPIDSLTGTGTINGQSVKCIAPGWMVKFHTGYKTDENDYRDVKALCQRFGIDLPAEFSKFVTKDGQIGLNTLQNAFKSCVFRYTSGKISAKETPPMAKKMFDFDKEFKLDIDVIDNEHVKLVDMLNEVYDRLAAGKRDEARQYFTETLSAYVNEHFANEEKFMESIGYPGLDEHKKIHENFKKSFQDLAPLIESYDETAFRKALSDAFSWIITHIGKTDKRYASFYLSK